MIRSQLTLAQLTARARDHGEQQKLQRKKKLVQNAFDPSRAPGSCSPFWLYPQNDFAPHIFHQIMWLKLCVVQLLKLSQTTPSDRYQTMPRLDWHAIWLLYITARGLGALIGSQHLCTRPALSKALTLEPWACSLTIWAQPHPQIVIRRCRAWTGMLSGYYTSRPVAWAP